MPNEYKRNEKQLSEPEEKYKLILENANDLITIINENYEREYINEKAYLEITGYSKEEIIGKSILTFLHPDDKKLARKALSDGFIEGKGRNEFRVKHKNGHYIWLSFKGRTFIDIDGKSKAIIISRDITERKFAEKKFEESEENYRSLVNNLTDIILEGDSKGIVTFVSTQCYEIMGYEPNEIKGKSALKYVHPEDVIIIAEAMKIALATKELIYVPSYRLLHKNGDVIYVSALGKYVKINNTDKFIVTIRDITTETRIKKKLKESEEKYRSLVNNLTDIIFELDVNGIITYISPQCFNIAGYQQNELIGKKALKFIHPENVLALAESMRNARDTKKLITASDFKLLHKNGNIIFASARGKHIVTNGMDRYIVTLRDITAKTKIEQKLKESEKKYRLISENANDLIFILKRNLKIEYVNEKPLLKLTGYSIEEVIGKRATNFIHLDDAKDALIKFYEAFSKEGQGTVEVRITHKMGHTIYVEINGSLFYNERGRPRALLITRDITERKKAENVKIEEYRKLEELSEIKSESIMRASHELKTPLSSVYTASQILLKNYKEQLGEEALSFLEIIYRGSQKLRQLIDNLLDVSRLESDELKLDLNKENLVELINECISDLKLMVDKRKLNIKADLPEQFILGVDRIRLEQVLINLLSNAIKFTPPKGNILITLNVQEKNVEISVKDTGIGLSKKEKDQLFQKFGKIDRFGKQFDINTEGTGLGLFISKELVELHKGKIIVKSQGRNKGSTFIIRLPK